MMNRNNNVVELPAGKLLQLELRNFTAHECSYIPYMRDEQSVGRIGRTKAGDKQAPIVLVIDDILRR